MCETDNQREEAIRHFQGADLRDALLEQSYAEIGKAIVTLLTVPKYAASLHRRFGLGNTYHGTPPSGDRDFDAIASTLPEGLRASHARAMRERKDRIRDQDRQVTQQPENSPSVPTSGGDIQQPSAECRSAEQTDPVASGPPTDRPSSPDSTTG